MGASAAGRLPVVGYLHRRHVWLVRDSSGQAQPPPLPAGFVLSRATAPDLPALKQLDAWFDRAPEFLERGHELWLVHEGEDLVFSTWVFRGTAPAEAAADGWIALPGTMANREDAITRPDRRGLGIAPAAYGLVFRSLVEAGVERMIVCVPLANAKNIRANAKAGMRSFALVDVVQVGLIRRGRNWRDRRSYPNRLSYRRVRVEAPPTDHADLAPDAEELRGWMRAALDAGRLPRGRGPGP